MLRRLYVFSKAINSTDEDGWAGLTWNHPTSVGSEIGAVAGYDRTHVFQLAWVYETPFGPGKDAGARRESRFDVARDWQITGHFSAYTGRPFTVHRRRRVIECPRELARPPIRLSPKSRSLAQSDGMWHVFDPLLSGR